MPVVPITTAKRTGRGGTPPTPPDEPFALMAAAQMHAEGRLIATPTGLLNERTRQVPND